MFYSDALLSKHETSSMAVVWISSTLGNSRTSVKKLSKKVRFHGTPDTRYIAAPPEPMALRLSSNLMVGVSRVLGNQYSFLYTDANQVFLRLKKAFSELPQSSTLLMDAVEAPYSSITLAASDELEIPFEESLLSFLEADKNVSNSQEKLTDFKGRATRMEATSIESLMDHGSSKASSVSARVPANTIARSKSISLNSEFPNELIHRKDTNPRINLLDSYLEDSLDMQDNVGPILDFGGGLSETFEVPTMETSFSLGETTEEKNVTAAPVRTNIVKKRKRVHFGDYESTASRALTIYEVSQSRKEKRRDRGLKKFAEELMRTQSHILALYLGDIGIGTELNPLEKRMRMDGAGDDVGSIASKDYNQALGERLYI
ncbi:hypothetical protein HDU67_002899 [Dinochytrium kinnereticum]|nr:hypothetical protein HDU67_002899 [Dinochytrium kinnereticum]